MKVSVQLNSLRYYREDWYDDVSKECNKITGLETIKGFSDDADIVLFSGTPEPGKNTKFMQSISAGVNHLNFSKISENILISSNADGYSIPVAETVIALLLSYAKKICFSNNEIHNGIYQQLEDKDYLTLYNKKLGILGYGGIGKESAKLASAFGMKIYVYSRSYEKDVYSEYMDIKNIMENCDFVLISFPLNQYTMGIINKNMLNLFKGFAIINAGRGEIVDHDDILNHLKNHKNFYYLTDVWYNEINMTEKIPDNVLITPHMAGMSDNVMLPVQKACNNIKNYINGNPGNVVNRNDYIK